MKNSGLTRREFIRKSLATGVAITGISSLQSCSGYDSKGLPTVRFGKTGVNVPTISIGLGSRWCSVEDEDTALEILEYAFNNGIYFWDTAHSYMNRNLGVVSEERIGKILKDRRDQVFLSTKVAGRNPEEAMKQVELSLERLQTDYVDSLLIHSVGNVEDAENITRSGGVMELMYRLREEGVARSVGFSSHSSAAAMNMMVERGDFDSVLVALNYYDYDTGDREGDLIPAAKDKDMGVLLMKAIRPKEYVEGVSTSELIRYALSIEKADSLCVGMDSIEIVKTNIDLVRNFSPMTPAEMSAFASTVNPFYDYRNVEWNRPGYRDGNWG